MLSATPPEKMSTARFLSISSTSSEKQNVVTIIGFGSLLSQKSAKTTFPHLHDFRLGKVQNYRRVFGHPASIFFQRGIANFETKEMSSLSAEYCPGASFICSVFEVSNENGEFMSRSGVESDPMPSIEFREREEEFEIVTVPYEERTNQDEDPNGIIHDIKCTGILCTRSTDENYIKLWGEERFDDSYAKYNIDTIWNWSEDSGLRPCGPYLRHCVLAAKNMGRDCYDSFLDETFLVDRCTTVREYLQKFPQVMDILPPPELAERYGG